MDTLDSFASHFGHTTFSPLSTDTDRIHTSNRSRYDLNMTLNTELIKQIARRHGATNIRIFGSYLHGTQKDDRDSDLLIDLGPGCVLFDLVALKRDLKNIIGRHVDVLTEGALSPYMREEILREAKPL
jgi:predicted nucleotidyltransferase